MVKGGDSYSEGVEFESQRQILDGHFSCIKGSFLGLKINEQRSGLAHFKEQQICSTGPQVISDESPQHQPRRHNHFLVLS